MPSCTVPTLSKMPLTTHMIHSDMPMMRITGPVASAMAPVVIRPSLHSHNASPTVEAMSRPLRQVTLMSMPVITRDWRWKRPTRSCMAARA